MLVPSVHVHLSVVVDAKSDCGTEMSRALLVMLDKGGIGCSWQDCKPCAFSQLVDPDEVWKRKTCEP